MCHLYVWHGLHIRYREGFSGDAAKVPQRDHGDGETGEMDGEGDGPAAEGGVSAAVREGVLPCAGKGRSLALPPDDWKGAGGFASRASGRMEGIAGMAKVRICGRSLPRRIVSE